MMRLPFLLQLFLMVLFCFFIEVIFTAFYVQLPYASTEDLRLLQRIEKMKDPTAYDILILGDSTAMQGIDPRTLQQETGLSAYNFATYRNVAAFADPALLERYLQHHPHPKAIIVGRSITMWQQPQRIDTAQEYFFSEGVLSAALPTFPIGLEEKIKIHLSAISGVFRNWHSFKRRIFATGQERQAVRDTFADIESHLGKRMGTGSALPGVSSDPLRDDFYAFPVENTILLSYLCSQAIHQTIPILFVTPPHAPVQDYSQENDPFPAKYNGYIERVLSFTDPDSTYCHYYRSSAFARPSDLSDGLHLNETGAVLYSQYLSGIIKEVIHR